MISLFYSLLLLSSTAQAFELERRQNAAFDSCVGNLGDQDLGILTADNSTYKNESQAFNLRFDFSPQAILFPTSSKEVSQVITCASQSNLSVSTRSGGHSYAAYALAGDVVIDMSKMKSLTVASDGTAVIQTGNLLGDVATKLWDNGKRALPHGSCPYVGTGGHAALGGYGFFSRVAGLLQDNIKGAEVVLANGTIANASTTENSDLFWALRGAGPSFGLVTSWTFQTHPAPATVIDFKISFGTLTQAQYSSALISYQAFGQTAPKELATQAVIGPDGNGGVFLSLQGDYYGSLEAFHGVVDGWIGGLPDVGRNLNATEVDWLGSLVAKDGPLSVSAPDVHDTFFAKSLLISQPSSNDSLAAYVKYMFTTGIDSKIPWFAEIDMWGGQISQLTTSDTSFAHRSTTFGYQLYSSSPGSVPPYPSSQIDFLNNMWATLSGNDSTLPAYANYIDPTLGSDVWPKAYYGTNGTFERLVGIKGVVDPGNLFRFAQSIPISSNGTGSTGGSSTTGGSGSNPTGTGAPTTTKQSDATAIHGRTAVSLTMTLVLLVSVIIL